MIAAMRGVSAWSGSFLSIKSLAKSLLLAGVSSLVIVKISTGGDYASSSIYSGVFDLVSIFTGFLATFYIFVVTKNNDFLNAIKRTNVFRRILHLLRFTILWSLFLIFGTYALMIVDLKDFEIFSISHGVVFIWAWNVFLIIVNFWRCLCQFYSILDVENS